MDAQPLLNRIKKNKKILRPYLIQNQITCYRVFDWDMPEFPLCIDIYEKHVHVSTYKTKFQQNEAAYNEWLHNSLQAIEIACEVERENIFVKTRERHHGTQYQKVNHQQQLIEVQEQGIKFYVNLSDYLDTGLFLDHRPLRQQVRLAATGKHILNLFAYTGSFSVYAAMGGAFTTTTVDLSSTYLQWAKNNFLLNGISIAKHSFIKADCKQWIQQTPRKKYDIIILDPPTLSKSKWMPTTFDVQADHVLLINHALQFLTPDGILYFSNNYRNFVLDEINIQTKNIVNITDKTIPPDFKNKKIHQCWAISNH